MDKIYLCTAMYPMVSYKTLLKHFLAIGLLFLLFCSVMGQANKKLPMSQRKISIHAENNQIVDATTSPPTQYLNGDVKLFHAATFMYCDTAILRGNFLRMRHNVVLLQNDTIRIFGDSLRYNGDSLVAYLYGNIILENGRSKKLFTTFIKYDLANKIAYYTQNAKLIDGDATLLSRKGKYDLNSKRAFFYGDVQGRGSNFFLVTDSVAYETEGQIMIFLAPTLITQDTSNIYCEAGYYNTKENQGQFIKNAQYNSGDTFSKGDTLFYDGKLDFFSIKSTSSRSKYFTLTDTALAYTIAVDRKVNEYILDGEAYYKSPKNLVIGKYVKYNKSKESFSTRGRTRISDPPNIIESDASDYNQALKQGEAHGTVIWQDTSNKTVIYCDNLFLDGSKDWMLAYNDSMGRPSFVSDIEGDTLTLKADTLKSYRVIKERIIYPKTMTDREKRASKINAVQSSVQVTSDSDTSSLLRLVDTILSPIVMDSIVNDTIFTGIFDTVTYIVCDNNVRMYKSDFQATSDSLVINRRDSILTFIDQPFFWTDSTQLSADTLALFIRNGKASKLMGRNNAIVINTSDEQFYNQTQGGFMVGTFDEEGQLKKMSFNDDSKIVYYLTDEQNRYIGVNLTNAVSVDYHIHKKKITDIKAYESPTSKVLPMDSADHEKIKVKGFVWNKKVRPISDEDL